VCGAGKPKAVNVTGPEGAYVQVRTRSARAGATAACARACPPAQLPARRACCARPRRTADAEAAAAAAGRHARRRRAAVGKQRRGRSTRESAPAAGRALASAADHRAAHATFSARPRAFRAALPAAAAARRAARAAALAAAPAAARALAAAAGAHAAPARLGCVSRPITPPHATPHGCACGRCRIGQAVAHAARAAQARARLLRRIWLTLRPFFVLCRCCLCSRLAQEEPEGTSSGLQVVVLNLPWATTWQTLKARPLLVCGRGAARVAGKRASRLASLRARLGPALRPAFPGMMRSLLVLSECPARRRARLAAAPRRGAVNAA
jgi:hypothetical protein